MNKLKAISDILISDRGTGQTMTMLLAAAARHLKTGKCVYIIGANKAHCKTLQITALEILSEKVVASMQFLVYNNIPDKVMDVDTFYDHYSLQQEILRLVELSFRHTGDCYEQQDHTHRTNHRPKL